MTNQLNKPVEPKKQSVIMGYYPNGDHTQLWCSCGCSKDTREQAISYAESKGYKWKELFI